MARPRRSRFAAKASQGARGPRVRGCQARSAGRAKEEAFDDAAAWDAVAEQARREDARVVDDEEIAGAEKRRQIADGRMMERWRLPIEDEQARRAPGCGLLRDQIVRELEGEVGDVHGAGAPMYCGTIAAG
jgi:hypothetical protein